MTSQNTGRIFIWIVAAALLHDLVAVPLYSLLLRIAHGSAAMAITSRAMALHALNHVRVPAGLSLLLLLVYAPLIFGFGADEYLATTGTDVGPYLGRWLLISAAMFLVSGVLYAIRLRRGIAEPSDMLAPVGEEEAAAPVSRGLRIGSGRGPRRDGARHPLDPRRPRRWADHQRALIRRPSGRLSAREE